MRLPTIFTSIQITITVLVIVIAYYTISNVTDKVIQRLSDDLLNQSTKVAQQIFDERSTSAYYSLQALLSTSEFIDAVESKNKSRIEDSLLNIYKSSIVNMPYDILFIHGEKNDFLVDAGYIKLDAGLLSLLKKIPPTKLGNIKDSLNFIQYKGLNLLTIKIAIPKSTLFLYGAIQISEKVSLLQTIKQQTNSQCIQIFNKNKLLVTVGKPQDCNEYFLNNLTSEHYFQDVTDGVGFLKRNISNQESLNFLDIGMVIPLDGILAFQGSLERFLFIVLLIVLFVALAVQFVFSKFISRSLYNIIQFTQRKNQNSSDVPKTGIMEFDKIAMANHEAMLSLQEEIKARQETEIKLHKSNEELVKKSKQANIANEEKSRFLANMSHEIRTPINAIINLARFTLRTDLNKRQRHYVDTIYQSSHTLLRLVNDVLDLSKIEANQLDLEYASFMLEKIIADVRDTVSSKVINKKVKLKLDIDPNLPNILEGDSLRLFQVLTNLCDNALKFTHDGSVTLQTKLNHLQDESVIIDFAVIDTGIGINTDKQKSIFDNFSQADSSITRKYGGTGLGLSIVTKLVKLMGGEIKVDSEVNKGSCFRFSLEFKIIDSVTQNNLFDNILDKDKLYLSVTNKQQTALSSMFTKVGKNLEICHSIQDLKQYINPLDRVDVVFLEWKDNGDRFQQPDIDSLCKIYEGLIDKIVWVKEMNSEELLTMEFNDTVNVCLAPPTFSELSKLLQNLDGSDEYKSQVNVTENLTQYASLFSEKNILVAEDNLVNQEVILTILDDVGVKPDIVSNGQAVLNQLDRKQYDLILMDVQMPILNGIEATRQIRKTYSLKDLPVIGLSAYAMKNEINKCLGAGMNDYVYKPINPEDIYKKLEQYIGGYQRVNTKSNSFYKILPTNYKKIEALPSLSGINVKEGLQRVSGNSDIFKKLLKSFLVSHEDYADKIEHAINNQDLSLSSDLLHEIKGAALMISANDLYESTKKAEDDCRAGKYDELFESFKLFKAKLEIVLSSIKLID